VGNFAYELTYRSVIEKETAGTRNIKYTFLEVLTDGQDNIETLPEA